MAVLTSTASAPISSASAEWEGAPIPASPKANKSVYISARYGKQIDTLIDAIAKTAPGRKRRVKVCIPYSEGSLVNLLHDTQKVDSESYGEKGTVMELRVDAETYVKIKKYLV